jgi:hypothetical protein
MKTLLLSFSLALMAQSALAKDMMPEAEARELADLVTTEIVAPEEVDEDQEVQSGGNVATRAWRWIRRQAESVEDRVDRELDVRRRREARDERIKALISQYRLGRGWPEATLKKIGEHMGVKVLDSFEALPAEVRTESLNAVIDTYSMLPGELIFTLKKRNSGIDVVADSVVNHPGMMRYRGVRPRNWPEGRTWDEVPGAGATGAHPTIIAGNSLNRGHGSVDLILHEVGHSVDRYFKNRGGGMDFSTTDMFTTLHAETPFLPLYLTETGASYQAANAEENFAEMFALYFTSERTRERLSTEFPQGLDYMRAMFGEP